MKIIIATTKIPFITGGAEIMVDMLRSELINRGHQVDTVELPFKWYPVQTLLDCMLAGRMLDLKEVNGEKIDKVIAVKFPAYYIQHENKTIWLMHQHRQAYDLWGTQYGDLHNMLNGDFIRRIITEHDIKYIKEAKNVYTISRNTSNRLKQYNQIESEVLYHPPLNYQKLSCKKYGNFIFYPSRIDPMKRQRLLVESARYIKTDTKIIIAGSGNSNEIGHINNLIKQYKLHDKVKLAGYISEDEKIEYYANCLGVYFGAYDEDYGYITLESFFSRKPIIVHDDAGGPLEFVNSNNGFIIDKDAHILAEKIDELSNNRQKARQMGEEGYNMLIKKNINWDYIISKLLV